jgi:hypothetical protein
VRKDLVLMCGEVFMEKVCARIKHGRKLWVTTICSKAFEFLFQLFFPPKSMLDLCQIQISFCLEGVKGSLQILASSGLL